ncbi:type VI secretion system secreted protein VgrG, partial [Pseudomonas sp. NFPP07]
AGYNELRIEDKKGAEQIFIHAQRDWDENIEHDQKIRIGHERHDTVEKNTYTELKAEEHRITHADRKTETKADDHLTVGENQHIKLGTAQLTKAGQEIHLKAGAKMVIEAGSELTIKAGGSFIKLDAGGVTVVGPVVKINAGGSPGSGTGIGILMPGLPGAADADKAGSLMEEALANPAKETVPGQLCIRISPLPNMPGYPDEPYQLYADGALIDKGFSDEKGNVLFQHIPGTRNYSVETVNGHRFNLDMSETSTEQTRQRSERLGREGYRDFPGAAASLEALSSSEAFRQLWADQSEQKE